MIRQANDPADSWFIDNRRQAGQDQFDEVWEGTYMMAPAPNNEHQLIGTKLGRFLDQIIGDPGRGVVSTTVNVSDREEGWERNYRIPDMAVFLKDSAAIDRGAYWQGGPDLAIEIVSEGDRSRDKLEFYASVGTRELLVIDRNPWRLELYRLSDSTMVSVGLVAEGEGAILVQGLAVEFLLRADNENDRPAIELFDKRTSEQFTI